MTGTQASRKWHSDLLASLVVFMVALPLCIAIAKACNVPPEVGLISGIIGGLIVGPLSGCSLQVSGPAAGLIILVLEFVKQRSELFLSGASPYSPLVALGVTTLLVGVMQLVLALLRSGPWFRAVTPAVILGMLGGIGIVIFAKQFHVMIDDKPADKVIDNLLTIPSACVKAFTDNDSATPNHQDAAMIGVVTLFVLVGWKHYGPKKLKFLPGALLAVVIAASLVSFVGLSVDRIVVKSNLLDAITWLSLDAMRGLLVDATIWKTAFVIALISSAETLLCSTAVDQMKPGHRTNYNRELFSQGVGNMLCGVVGALPMTGVIVRSSANVEAGGQTRLSATLHGLWLLLFVILAPGLIGLIPSASLAAILVLTGIKLLDFKSIHKLYKESRSEALIFAITLLGVLFTDLLTGVILGIIASVIKLVYTFTHLSIRRSEDITARRVDLHLEGAATFVRLPQLAEILEAVPAGYTLHVHLDELVFIDHACLQLFTDWEKQHRASGGELFLDWESLHARFDSRNPSRAIANGAVTPVSGTPVPNGATNRMPSVLSP